MNELAVLFHTLGLDTREVLEAAGTKWNFLPFDCGFVGGHCIPVDPYYLTHKAQEVSFHADLILAGRRINDSMGPYVAREVVKLLIQAGKVVRGARVLVLGVAFKENVSDVRNTRVVAMDMARSQVTCNAVAPFAATRVTESIQPANEAQAEYKEIALTLPPESVADFVAYLCSPEARNVSGQLFGVRGREIFLFSQPRPAARLVRNEGDLAEAIEAEFAPLFTELTTDLEAFNTKPVL